MPAQDGRVGPYRRVLVFEHVHEDQLNAFDDAKNEALHTPCQQDVSGARPCGRQTPHHPTSAISHTQTVDKAETTRGWAKRRHGVGLCKLTPMAADLNAAFAPWRTASVPPSEDGRAGTWSAVCGTGMRTGARAGWAHEPHTQAGLAIVGQETRTCQRPGCYGVPDVVFLTDSQQGAVVS